MSELPKVLSCAAFYKYICYLRDVIQLIFGVQWEDSLNEKYPHIVYEEFCEAREPNEASSEEDHNNDKIEGS